MREALHELNNPLAVILNYTVFVLEDTPDDDPPARGPAREQARGRAGAHVSLSLLAAPEPD